MAEDISTPMTVATTPTNEAIDHVAGGMALGIAPADYAQSKEVLKPTLDSLQAPRTAEKTVADYAYQSPDHAAAIKPDVDHLSWMSREFKAIGQAVGRGIDNPDQERKDLLWEKMNNGGQFADSQKEFRLKALNLDAKDNYGEQDYNLKSAYERFPVGVAEAVAGLPGMVLRNKKLFAGIIGAETSVGAATGALGGAAVTAPAGGVGAIPGSLIGALSGLGSGTAHAFLATTFIDSYKNTAAETYGSLGDLRDDNGKQIPIDEQTKYYLSHGIGAVVGTLNVASGKLLLDNVPFVKNLIGPKLGGILAENPALKDALISMGKTAAGTGTISGMQTFAAQLVHELALTKTDNNPLNFTEALINADKAILHNKNNAAGQLAESTAIGAGTGAIAHLAGSVANAVALKGARGVRENVRASRSTMGERDVTPAEPLKLNPGQSSVGQPGEIVIHPDSPSPTDLHVSMSQMEEVHHVLQFQDAVEATSHVIKETNLHKTSPQVANDLRGKMLEDAGIGTVWIDKEGAQEFVAAGKDDAEKTDRALKFRNFLSPRGEAAANLNAPISLMTKDAMQIQDQYPDLSYFLKLSAEGPSPKNAEQLLAKMEEQAKNLTAIRSKINVGEKSPEERAYKATIKPESSDADLVDQLGSKEVAQAYLDRLDVNEIQIKSQEVGLHNTETIAPALEKLQQIQALRERVTSLKKQLPDDVTAKETLQAALVQEPTSDIHNESDFLNQPTLTEAIKDISPDKEAERIDAAARGARESIAANINESALLEMNSVRDIYREMAEESVKQTELEKAANDPNVAIVDKFYERTHPLGEILTAGHKKKGHSIFAIDPETLTKTQAKRYSGNKLMNEHKAFVKGGISPDQAAELLGVNTGENLLRILSTTDSTKNKVALAVQKLAPVIDQMAERSVDLDHTAISDAYHKASESHLEVMKYLKDKKWPATKQAIKRIALDVPRRKDLTRQAEAAISQVKVGDLNANQFKVGERRSNRIAMKDLTDGNILGAFVNKKSAALNVELALATMKKTAQVNRVVKLIRRLESTENQKIMTKAGAGFIKAYNEIVDTYNLVPTKKDTSIAGSYQKWVAKQVKQGHGNFGINIELSDTRKSINDLTVEETLTLGKRLNTIHHSAVIENQLIAERELTTIAQVVDELHNEAVVHRDYNEKRLVTGVTNKNLSIGYRLQNVFNESPVLSSFKDFEHIIVNLDKGNVRGKFNERFVAPLLGIGRHGDKGFTARGNDRVDLDKFFNKAIKEFREEGGRSTALDKAASALRLDEWAMMKRDVVFVEDWKDNLHLSEGHVSKAHLLMMMLHQGNSENKVALTDGHGISQESVERALDEHLDAKYANLAQKIMDKFKRYYPRVVDLQTRLEGEVPKMVEAEEWSHRGVKRLGGYYPIRRDSHMDIEAIRNKNREAINLGDVKLALKDSFWASDMTQHNHTNARVGGTTPVSLQIDTIGMNFEGVIHDLAFREVIADGVKLLSEKTLANDVTAIVGQNDYKVLLNSYVYLARSARVENQMLFDSGQWFEKFLARNQNVQSVGLLAYNLGAHAIQPLSLIFASERMGVKGNLHMAGLLKTLATNPALWHEMEQFAGEVYPPLHHNAEGVNDQSKNLLTKKLGKNIAKGMQPIAAINEAVTELAFKSLGFIDDVLKTLTINTAYKQFMAGDAEGFDIKKILDMSPEDRDQAAKEYASSTIRLTLTMNDELSKAPIQQDPKLKYLAPFWNDSRNIVNNQMRMMREMRYHVEDTVNAENAKEFTKSGLRLAHAATVFILVSAAAKFYVDTRYGFNTPDFSNAKDDPKQFGQQVVDYIKWAPVDFVAGEFPIGREVNFALQSYLDKGFTHAIPLPLAFKPVMTTFETLKIVNNYIDGYTDVTTNEAKTLAWQLSYATSAYPVNALFKLYDAYQNTKEGNYKPALLNQFADKLDNFLKKQETAEGKEKVPQEVIDEMKKIKVQINPGSQDGNG